MQSDQINELAAALAKAQGQMKSAAKDSVNPFFKSKYADLASVWDCCRIPLAQNGLAVAQTSTCDEGGQLLLVTTLIHASGQWVSGVLPISPVKNDPQGIGSAITYMRRYALQMIAGIAAEDDDGEAAQSRQDTPPQSHQKTNTTKSKPQVAQAPAQSILGVAGAGDYVVPFGKFERAALRDIPISELQSYRAYLLKTSQAANKTPSEDAKKFIAALAAWEPIYYARQRQQSVSPPDKQEEAPPPPSLEPVWSA